MSGADPGPVEILSRLIEELAGSADALIEVYSDRVKHSVRQRFVRAWIVAGVAVFTAFVLAAAALATVRGIQGGFTALWGGREWLGDLTGGLLAVVAVAGVTAARLRWSANRELERLKVKYERDRNRETSDQERDREAPSAIGGSTAGSAGSVGDAAHHGRAAERE